MIKTTVTLLEKKHDDGKIEFEVKCTSERDEAMTPNEEKLQEVLMHFIRNFTRELEDAALQPPWWKRMFG